MRNHFLLILIVSFAAIGVLAKSLQNNSPAMSKVAPGCYASDLTGIYSDIENVASLDGVQIPVPQVLADELEPLAVLGEATPSDKWIEVDLSEQTLKAWDGTTLFLETKIASGLPWTPTPRGEFHIWGKFRYTKMEGGQGKYYYYLPNVPYVMFFENEKVPGYKGYGLHGTYWHNSFGTPRSHGCVNLPTTIAGQLYNWTGPVLPPGRNYVRATPENPGTKIVIHD